MAVIVTEILCPHCEEPKSRLIFWKKIGDIPFYLCDKCQKKSLSNDELLLLGYKHGGHDEQHNIKQRIDAIFR